MELLARLTRLETWRELMDRRWTAVTGHDGSSGTEPALSTSKGRVKLYNGLAQLFSEDELIELAGVLQVDYESLPGRGKRAKAVALVEHLDNRGRLYRLIGECQKLRPHVDWAEF